MVKKSKKNFLTKPKVLPEGTERAVRRGSIKKIFLKISQTSQGNKFIWFSFLMKLQACRQMFSCEVCEIFKKTYFTQHLQTTASVDTKNSFKTGQRSHQEMLYVICDLPTSDVSCEITWKFTKILERNKWKSVRPTACDFIKILLNFEKQPL